MQSRDYNISHTRYAATYIPVEKEEEEHVNGGIVKGS